jgi:glycolate dehydrogenase iron-sulfur subunit
MIDRELIDACTHCGFCLPTCPTYGPLGQMEADSPRGRIWLMQGLADGTMTANASVVEHIDRCLGCMACVTACPSGVRYDLLIEQTRELVEEEYERPAGDWLLRSLVFSVFPHPRRLRVALAMAPLAGVMPGRLRVLGDLAPPWRSHEQPPQRTLPSNKLLQGRGRVGLLTGCVQSVVFGDVNVATARVLAAEGFEVVAPLGQACCGALHLHAGKREEGRLRARALGKRFRAAGVDAIAVNAAGCGSHLKEAGIDMRVADVHELLTEPRAERHSLGLRVAFQDSCHLSHAQGIRVEPRELLDGIPGLERLEPAEQAICCGSAGIYNLTQPDAARELGDRKAGHVLATEPEVYTSANPGCLVQVSAALRRAGRALPALHPIELLDASIRGRPVAELLATARR